MQGAERERKRRKGYARVKATDRPRPKTTSIYHGVNTGSRYQALEIRIPVHLAIPSFPPSLLLLRLLLLPTRGKF